MAIKYMLDEDSRDTLDRRIRNGNSCIDVAAGFELPENTDDSETYARDAVSNILSALFGPAGQCVVKPTGKYGQEYGSEVVLDGDKIHTARTFLDMALESWEGDAEDYTATAVTVDNPLLPSEGFKGYDSYEAAVETIQQRLNAVEAQYRDEVVPGVSDNSVLEAERDTLQEVLAILGQVKRS